MIKGPWLWFFFLLVRPQMIVILTEYKLELRRWVVFENNFKR